MVMYDDGSGTWDYFRDYDELNEMFIKKIWAKKGISKDEILTRDTTIDDEQAKEMIESLPWKNKE